MVATLKSARLLLRAAQESDLDAMHAMSTNEDVMKYWSTAPHTSIEQSRDSLLGCMNPLYNGITDFTIALRDPKDPTKTPPTIGRIGCWDGKEIGFRLDRSHWGNGYMTEAMEVFLPYFWDLELVDAIVADVDPRNEACLKLLRRFGFLVTGFAENTFETQIGWCDSVYLRLERPRASGEKK
ncbi:MAG: hypothetical protein M1839_005703 [Geoglossum umbratile]|nr:MAG: hypothetical protein M1839_005703 [Geoglossum umbratile]